MADPTAPKPYRETARTRARRKTAESALIALDWCGGKTIPELAAAYNLSDAQVQNRLKLAELLGMTEKFRAVALERLIPSALAVVEAHVMGGSLEAARDVLYGLGVFQKGGANATIRVIPGETTEPKTIDQYRQYRKRKAVQGHEALAELEDGPDNGPLQ